MSQQKAQLEIFLYHAIELRYDDTVQLLGSPDSESENPLGFYLRNN